MLRMGSYIGLAGEFRVMSELLLRGHNPAKSYLEDGADIILENGKKIEVKSSHKFKFKSRGQGRSPRYLFGFRGGNRQKQNLNRIDFVICWCIDDGIFYVIPTSVITGLAVQLSDTSINARHKYSPYRENWKILD